MNTSRTIFQAFFALWNRKSDIGLVGNTINNWNGVSLTPTAVMAF
jgi:mannosidase alpha-like ER degradation enhancer 1